MVEITSEEQNKGKRMKRTEDSLRDLWDTITHQHSNYTGYRRRRKKKVYEKTFEEIVVENFPNMEKEIVNQVQKAERVLYRISPRRNMPRHILIKLTKTKHKERILKATREKQQLTIQGKPHMFKIKKIRRNKEGHYIMIKGSIQEDNITIVNIYA